MGQVIISKPFQKTQLVYSMCVFIYLYAHILKDKVHHEFIFILLIQN